MGTLVPVMRWIRLPRARRLHPAGINSGTVLWTVTLSALVAACAAPSRDEPAANRPTVEGNRPVDGATAPAVAASPSATMAYRLKMADGTMQEVVQTGERFEVGERAEVTREGRRVRP